MCMKSVWWLEGYVGWNGGHTVIGYWCKTLAPVMGGEAMSAVIDGGEIGGMVHDDGWQKPK